MYINLEICAVCEGNVGEIALANLKEQRILGLLKGLYGEERKGRCLMRCQQKRRIDSLNDDLKQVWMLGKREEWCKARIDDENL